ncbi:hypothetical protein M5689_000965 [Euphorbia peplus]|nr:hypothetical protein M5689_000965 [Euphorbia peplus]
MKYRTVNSTPSDELHTASDSEEDSKPKYSEFNMERDFYSPHLELGMLFGDFGQFKTSCINWSIKNRFEIVFSWNDTVRCICKCSQNTKERPCYFKIHASHVSKTDPTVKIKSINLQHTCGMVFKNLQAKSAWLAKKYYDQFKSDLEWSTNGIMKLVQTDLSLTISREKARRMRGSCKKMD